MPAYEYELFDPLTGEVVEVVTAVRPVDKRNSVEIRRRELPRSIAIAGSAVACDAIDRTVMRGYQRQEEKLGSRFRSKFSADQVKRSLILAPDPLEHPTNARH